MADEAAKDLFAKGSNHKNSFRLMYKVLDKGVDDQDLIPDSFSCLMEEVYAEPNWLDRNKVEKGAAVCRRLGGWAMTVLGDLALLGGYANPEITKPLVFTGTLTGESTFDRISETSQFWFDVTRKGALEKGAKGFKSAIKVRMMHAIVRQRMLNHPKWNAEDWGWPINKADAVATNVGFSMVMIYGAKMLGFNLSNKDIEAVLHLWKYIGYLMGDEVNWLSVNAEEGLQCLLLITLSNNNIPDKDSKRLAIDYLENFIPRSSIFDLKNYPSELFNYIKHRAYAEFPIPPDILKN